MKLQVEKQTSGLDYWACRPQSACSHLVALSDAPKHYITDVTASVTRSRSATQSETSVAVTLAGVRRAHVPVSTDACAGQETVAACALTQFHVRYAHRVSVSPNYIRPYYLLR